MKRLLAVLIMAAAFVFGGTAFAQSNLERAKAELAVIDARAQVLESRVAVEQFWREPAPLPALPVPPVMTDRGVVQAPNPRPTADFPVAKSQPFARLQPVARPLPAIKAPSVATEKGKVETPSPRPTQDFPTAKPQQQTPAEIKRTKGFLDGKAVVVNQENIHVNVMLSASNNLGRNVALEVKPGEYVLLRGTMTGWEPVQQKPVKEVPRGYKVVKGQEVKS